MRLTEESFMTYAMHNYDRASCVSIVEFEEDLKKFLYVRKLLLRYKRDGDLKERLILNHIIVLFNVFGNAAIYMLFFKIDKECWEVLVSFLIYLQKMPNEIPEYDISINKMVVDDRIIDALRKL